MKYLVQLARIVVGVLFIISGFIKLNDPVGFSFKLEEYFSPPVLDLPFFEPYALAIALFVVILEVILGITLLLGVFRKLTLITLLGTILFFTFLTFYSAYYNKVTDCGCFGDAVKLTPWESFTKDVILLVLILFLIAGKKYIRPLFTPRTGVLLTGIAVLACVWFANHVLNHLPWIDFRPYHIGANIEEGMSVPPDAPQPVFEYAWKFDVEGKEEIIVTQGDYPTVEGEFIDVETTEIQKGYEPPIHDFSIEKNGLDLTTEMLNQPNLLMVVSYDLSKAELDAFEEISRKADSALSKGYRVIGMSASPPELLRAIEKEYQLPFSFYFTDQTTLKTIVRSNPGVLTLQQGTILQKVHYKDLDDLDLKTLSSNERYDLELKKTLDSIMDLDQKYRANVSMDTWALQMEIDSSNMILIDSLVRTGGYPGKSRVGEKTGEAAWYVIQHSDRIDEFLPVIQVAAETGELPYRLYAMMLDRSLMYQGKPQVYGTQGRSYYMGTPQEISFIWPLDNPEEVNERRRMAGFETSVEESGKNLFGPDFEYRAYTMEEVKEIENRITN